jgi:single-strand DNA-binding protein
MIRASIYGRLGADPVERETRTGKAMATASLAVSAGRHDAGKETVWFNLAAFGRAGKDLMRHQKGDLIACIGPLYRSRYTARDDQERESWSLTVEAIVSARTVRPSGGRKRLTEAKPAADTSPDDGRPFDDPIPGMTP